MKSRQPQPESPSNRSEELLTAIIRGTDTSGVVLERAILLSPGDTLAPHFAPVPTTTVAAEVTRLISNSVLNQTHWVIERDRGAGKILNLDPSTLRSRMQTLGIKRPGRPA